MKEGNAISQLKGQQAQPLRPECSHNNPMGGGPSKVTHIPRPSQHCPLGTGGHTVVHALQEQVCTSAHNTKPTNAPHTTCLINAALPESRLTHPHVHANTHVHTHVCTHKHMCTHTCKHTCAYICTPTGIHLTLYFHLASDLLLVCSRISSLSTSFCVLITSLLGTLRTLFVA